MAENRKNTSFKMFCGYFVLYAFPLTSLPLSFLCLPLVKKPIESQFWRGFMSLAMRVSGKERKLREEAEEEESKQKEKKDKDDKEKKLREEAEEEESKQKEKKDKDDKEKKDAQEFPPDKNIKELQKKYENILKDEGYFVEANQTRGLGGRYFNVTEGYEKIYAITCKTMEIITKYYKEKFNIGITCCNDQKSLEEKIVNSIGIVDLINDKKYIRYGFTVPTRRKYNKNSPPPNPEGHVSPIILEMFKENGKTKKRIYIFDAVGNSYPIAKELDDFCKENDIEIVIDCPDAEPRQADMLSCRIEALGGILKPALTFSSSKSLLEAGGYDFTNDSNAGSKTREAQKKGYKVIGLPPILGRGIQRSAYSKENKVNMEAELFLSNPKNKDKPKTLGEFLHKYRKHMKYDALVERAITANDPTYSQTKILRTVAKLVDSHKKNTTNTDSPDSTKNKKIEEKDHIIENNTDLDLKL